MPMKFNKVANPNPDFVEQQRPARENNIDWLARAIAALGGDAPLEQSYILLLGANDTLSWRLRIGQSHLRFDLLPSYWSSAVLLKLHQRSLKESTVIHVPLFQPADGLFATERNGVVETPLSEFGNTRKWKNIALITFPVPQETVLSQLLLFEKGRSYIDALEHVLRWLAFAWGVARTPNPIHDGVGLPSACMLETLFASAGLDITPGLESRASSPEAIWATALYWYEHYTTNRLPTPKGRFFTPHDYEIKDGR
ncbi:hypothetical protein PF66_01754 [Pseudomonas asplenii]|uniref:Uncharacterized protein n=2 Tax=Pseudomonas TaxID=286 RepID=A0A0M9GI01_9PSED|nr:hypothetical protein PF66_01754 [Pseudomonas fuscovaginae]